MKFKSILSLVLVLALLGGVCVGFASAGSASDPLITKSHADGKYADDVIAKAEKAMDDAFANAYKQALAESTGTSSGFRKVNVAAGSEIQLNFGGSAILTSGAAKLTVVKGAVINVTEGYASLGGDARIGHRYMAAEDSQGSLKFSTAAEVLLDGDAKVVTGSSTGSCPFTDIKSSDWFYADVMSAVDMGLINGMTATTFVPDGTITHAQVIKLASCTHQKYHEGKVTLRNGDPWYQTYVDYALANGIIGSVPADMDAACSRAYYIAVMYGAMPEREYGRKNDIPDDAVPDVKQGDAYYDEIYGFYRAGIVTGNDDKGTFAPNSNVKRSEVATLVARMFNTEVRKSVSLAQ